MGVKSGIVVTQRKNQDSLDHQICFRKRKPPLQQMLASSRLFPVLHLLLTVWKAVPHRRALSSKAVVFMSLLCLTLRNRKWINLLAEKFVFVKCKDETKQSFKGIQKMFYSLGEEKYKASRSTTLKLFNTYSYKEHTRTHTQYYTYTCYSVMLKQFRQDSTESHPMVSKLMGLLCFYREMKFHFFKFNVPLKQFSSLSSFIWY